MIHSQILDSEICTNKCKAQCCIETEMNLTLNDIHRIEKAGYKKTEFSIQSDGFTILANKNKNCVFLDSLTKKCKIYSIRPYGCRLYPLILEMETDKVIIDSICPYGHLISQKLIIKLEKKIKKFITQILDERIEINY